ncbi:MAG: MucB/RseB C-terminal domain-containing protein [Proteobacteria bacterium]|nr:MucB/RseB C-terminal domain-containing protein [Pseudomonadota bacterium]
MLRIVSRRRARRMLLVPATAVSLWVAHPAWGQDATQWLARVSEAARTQNYVGTIVYQHNGRVETSRLAHIADNGQEFERMTSLDGPAREVVRSDTEVRCYYPDAKVLRIEPRTFRNVFPSLTPEQQSVLAQFYDFQKGEQARVAGYEAQAYVFVPKDGLRYGHKFWADTKTGLLLKARVIGDNGDVVEQFGFMDVTIGGPVDRALVQPTWPVTPPDWKVREGAGETTSHPTGFTVTRLPPGFVKIMEGYRTLRGKPEPVAHLVFSDGLVAVSVFVEPAATAPAHAGFGQQGGVNIYSVRLDDNLVTALGEVPAVTVRQIANAVARR